MIELVRELLLGEYVRNETGQPGGDETDGLYQFAVVVERIENRLAVDEHVFAVARERIALGVQRVNVGVRHPAAAVQRHGHFLALRHGKLTGHAYIEVADFGMGVGLRKRNRPFDRVDQFVGLIPLSVFVAGVFALAP